MEAKDSKGNVIKAGDTVKVLRKPKKEEQKTTGWDWSLDQFIGKEFEAMEIDNDGDVRLSNGLFFNPNILEKVQATPETFKVLITGYVQEWRWYKGKIGDIIEVNELSQTEFKDASKNGMMDIISKSDCHVIEPVWKVMKDAEETGGSVEFWHEQRWLDKTGGGWYSDNIYRLAPEPKQSEYVEYSYEDREKLRGLWVVDKADKQREVQIIGLSHDCVYAGPDYALSYRELFDDFLTAIDGQPVGKLKTT